MPGGDRTGPRGFGPMTGRGFGYCAGYSAPGYANPIPGRGWFGRGFGRGRGWFGRGFGRGWRNQFHGAGYPGYFGAAPDAFPYAQEITPAEEVKILKDQAAFLKNELQEIQNRIGTLEKTKDK